MGHHGSYIVGHGSLLEWVNGSWVTVSDPLPALPSIVWCKVISIARTVYIWCDSRVWRTDRRTDLPTPCFTALCSQRPEKQFTCLDRLFHWCICSRNGCDLWLQEHWLTAWTSVFHQCYSSLLRFTAGSIQQLHMTPCDQQKHPSLQTLLYNIFDRGY